jgi:hypothetical protein
MKIVLKTYSLVFLPLVSFASRNDSLHFQLLGGSSFSTYYSTKLKISNNPIGYRFGLSVSKEAQNNFVINSNIWFQNISFTKIKTYIYDEYYYENVFLTTDITYKQFGFSFEANKHFSKFFIGINTGINFLIKSNTTQNIEGGIGITATNIYYKYIVYDYQQDSFYNTINPFVGISVSYFPLTQLGIKYENNFDILSSPSMNYQYFHKLHPFINNIILILKIN